MNQKQMTTQNFQCQIMVQFTRILASFNIQQRINTYMTKTIVNKIPHRPDRAFRNSNALNRKGLLITVITEQNPENTT